MIDLSGLRELNVCGLCTVDKPCNFDGCLNDVRDQLIVEFEMMRAALEKLSGPGWLFWPAARQPDPRVVVYESRTLKEIQDLAREALK